MYFCFTCRYRDEILKFQKENDGLKNELYRCQIETYKTRDDVNGEIHVINPSGIKQEEISDLVETPQLAMEPKKRCKDLLSKALTFEVRFTTFSK